MNIRTMMRNELNRPADRRRQQLMALKRIVNLASLAPKSTVSLHSRSLFSSSCSAIGVARSSVADVAGVSRADLLYPDRAAVKTTVPNVLQPGVVIYDGICHLCHRGVKLVIKADKEKKIKFCCLQSKAAEPYLRVCGLEREDVSRRFLFVEGPALYHQASTAALKVMSYLPFPYSALSSLLIIPTPLRDAIYDYIAKRRYDWFGKAEDCLVLEEKELLERFIDREEMFSS